MSNKNDAMNNFQDAINKSSKKNEEDKKTEERRKQEQQEEFERKNQQNTPTSEVKEPGEEIKPQTKEELEAEKAKDAINYNIYDDDYDDEDENNNNSNNPINRRRNNKDKDDDDNDDNDNDNDNDNTEQDNGTDNATDSSTEKTDTDSTDNNNTIDDSEKSSGSSSKDGSAHSDGTSPSGQEAGTSTNTGTSAGGTTGATTSSGAAEAGAATEAGAGATEAGAAAGGATTAGATAGAGTGAGATAGTAVAAGGPTLWVIILIIALVIIGLIIVIGYIGFFINGVGLIREKLGEFADTIWTGFTGFFVGADVAQVKDEQIYDMAQYLEDMGYDLAYSGFLDTNGKAVTKEKNEDGGETIKAGNKIIYQTKLNEETGKLEINKLESKYIKAYLAAENNTYMIANQHWTFTDIFFTPIADMDEWGTGMIHLENASSKVKIDRENKKMQIKYKGYVYQYDLDGWTGRYRKILGTFTNFTFSNTSTRLCV